MALIAKKKTKESPRNLNRRAENLSIALALACFALFLRLATLMPIHTGVDERDYWHSAKAIARGLPYPELTHRTVRFSVILPTAIGQLVAGSGPNSYYVMPILNSMFQAALFFLIGTRLHGRLAGILAGLGIILFPYMIRAGSQVRPEIFSISYMATACYFFIRFIESKKHGYRWIVLCGFSIFVGYLAKITNLFFLPGFAIAAFLARKRLRDPVILCIVPFILYLIETPLYAIFTPYPLGQLQVISANHLDGNAALQEVSFLGLFLRYAPRNLDAYWSIAFILFAILSFRACYNKSWRINRLSLILPGVSFFFFLTFAVKSFDPVVPAEPFINRYFSAVLVPVILVIAIALAELITSVMRVRLSMQPTQRHKAVLVWTGLGFSSIVLILLSAILPIPDSYRIYLPHPFRLGSHPISSNSFYQKTVTESWDLGRPIVAKRNVSASNVAGINSIMTAVHYYLDYSRYPMGVPPRPASGEIGGFPLFIISDPSKGNSLSTDRVVAAIRNPFRLRFLNLQELGRLGETVFTEE